MNRELEGVCEWPGCYKDATKLVYNRKSLRLLACCDPHTTMVLRIDDPEYTHTCPNCGCVSGVN